MTKDEAFENMKAGKRMTHIYYSDDQFLFMKDGFFYDEEGYCIGSETDQAWQEMNLKDGWSEKTFESIIEAWIKKEVDEELVLNRIILLGCFNDEEKRKAIMLYKKRNHIPENAILIKNSYKTSETHIIYPNRGIPISYNYRRR